MGVLAVKVRVELDNAGYLLKYLLTLAMTLVLDVPELPIKNSC
jgi:hypothetical protein